MTEIGFHKFDDKSHVESSTTEAAPALTPSRISPRETLDFQLTASGSNKLLEVATPLLGLAVRIRSLPQYDDVGALHERLANEVRGFENELKALDYDPATVLAARYALCAMVDESILSQTWGAESLWPERPLLSVFHNETWGGEKFFSILDRVTSEAHRYVDLLEFLYICMTLGFEGKYHVMHNGQTKLDQLIGETWKALENCRGEQPQRLTNPHANVAEKGQHLRRRIPLWVWGGLTVLALIIIHQIFDYSLSNDINTIGAEIESVLNPTRLEER